MPLSEKSLEWVGSSHKDLMALPVDARRFFGFALSLAQAGDKHDAAKVLKGFGGAGVLEVVEDDVGDRQCSSFTVFRRKVSAASPRPRKTWTSSTPG